MEKFDDYIDLAKRWNAFPFWGKLSEILGFSLVSNHTRDSIGPLKKKKNIDILIFPLSGSRTVHLWFILQFHSHVAKPRTYRPLQKRTSQ